MESTPDPSIVAATRHFGGGSPAVQVNSERCLVRSPCGTIVSELAPLRLPHRSVMGEDDSSGVEGLEALDPVRYRWEIISMAVVRGARREEVASKGRRRVMALAGD